MHRIIINQVSSNLRVASANLSGFDVGYVSSTSRSRSQALVAQITCPLTLTTSMDDTPAMNQIRIL